MLWGPPTPIETTASPILLILLILHGVFTLFCIGALPWAGEHLRDGLDRFRRDETTRADQYLYMQAVFTAIDVLCTYLEWKVGGSYAERTVRRVFRSHAVLAKHMRIDGSVVCMYCRGADELTLKRAHWVHVPALRCWRHCLRHHSVCIPVHFDFAKKACDLAQRLVQADEGGQFFELLATAGNYTSQYGGSLKARWGAAATTQVTMYMAVFCGWVVHETRERSLITLENADPPDVPGARPDPLRDSVEPRRGFSFRGYRIDVGHLLGPGRDLYHVLGGDGIYNVWRLIADHPDNPLPAAGRGAAERVMHRLGEYAGRLFWAATFIPAPENVQDHSVTRAALRWFTYRAGVFPYLRDEAVNAFRRGRQRIHQIYRQEFGTPDEPGDDGRQEVMPQPGLARVLLHRVATVMRQTRRGWRHGAGYHVLVGDGRVVRGRQGERDGDAGAGELQLTPLLHEDRGIEARLEDGLLPGPRPVTMERDGLARSAGVTRADADDRMDRARVHPDACESDVPAVRLHLGIAPLAGSGLQVLDDNVILVTRAPQRGGEEAERGDHYTGGSSSSGPGGLMGLRIPGLCGGLQGERARVAGDTDNDQQHVCRDVPDPVPAVQPGRSGDGGLDKRLGAAPLPQGHAIDRTTSAGSELPDAKPAMGRIRSQRDLDRAIDELWREYVDELPKAEYGMRWVRKRGNPPGHDDASAQPAQAAAAQADDAASRLAAYKRDVDRYVRVPDDYLAIRVPDGYRGISTAVLAATRPGEKKNLIGGCLAHNLTLLLRPEEQQHIPKIVGCMLEAEDDVLRAINCTAGRLVTVARDVKTHIVRHFDKVVEWAMPTLTTPNAATVALADMVQGDLEGFIEVPPRRVGNPGAAGGTPQEWPGGHLHRCMVCGARYKHYHPHTHEDHSQRPFQCPVTSCPWYFGRGETWTQRSNNRYAVLAEEDIVHQAWHAETKHQFGDPVETYDLRRPMNAVQAKASKEVLEAPTHPDTLVTPVSPNPYRKDGRRELKRQYNESVAEGYIGMGYEKPRAAAMAGISAQGRWGAQTPSHRMPAVASSRSAANERACVHARHFPAPTRAPSPRQLTRMREVTSSVMDFLLERTTASYDGMHFTEFLPKGWSEKAKERATVEAVTRGHNYVAARKLFVKANEALLQDKTRPRGIQSVENATAALNTVSCSWFEYMLFRDKFIESRSIKHTDTDALSSRVFTYIERFIATGGVMSVDFGRWDSTIGNPIRENIENHALSRLMDHYKTCISPLDGPCREDRNRDSITLKGRYWTVKATQFGRQSGDRGTSVLNFLTNLTLFLCMVDEIEPAGIDVKQYLLSMEDESSDFDCMFEGDDNMPAVTGRAIDRHGGKNSLFTKIKGYYDSIGLNWEPAARGGATAQTGIEGILKPTDRMEFTSKFFILVPAPVATGLVRMLQMPKLDKAIRAMCVSFSHQGDFSGVAICKCLSGMHMCYMCPILYRAFWALAMIISGGSEETIPDLAGGAQIDRNYRGFYYEAVTMGGSKKCLEKAKDRRNVYVGYGTDAIVRTFIAYEYPKLSVGRQTHFEERLGALRRNVAAQAIDTSWAHFEEIIEEIGSAIS